MTKKLSLQSEQRHAKGFYLPAPNSLRLKDIRKQLRLNFTQFFKALPISFSNYINLLINNIILTLLSPFIPQNHWISNMPYSLAISIKLNQ
ncbi:hypothetical protein A1348_16245 [Pseudomonas protegens]|nr:hypothetical protein A1348_16245 [Pseudomonas protegens]